MFFRAGGKALAHETSAPPFVMPCALAHLAMGSQCSFEHLIRTRERLVPADTLVLYSSVLPKRSKFLKEARPGQTLVVKGGRLIFPLAVLSAGMSITRGMSPIET